MRGNAPTTSRRIANHSEVAFIGLPGNAGWLGFRRVASQRQGSRGRGPVARAAADRRREGRLRSGAAAARRERAAQSWISAHHQPAEPAARVSASAQPPSARHGSTARKKSAASTPPAWSSRNTRADDHPETWWRRHAELEFAPGSSRPRDACCGPSDDARLRIGVLRSTQWSGRLRLSTPTGSARPDRNGGEVLCRAIAGARSYTNCRKSRLSRVFRRSARIVSVSRQARAFPHQRLRDAAVGVLQRSA